MLRWDELSQFLRDYLDESDGVAYLITPFITPHMLDEVLGGRSNKGNIVLTSWRPDHLRSGASSLDTFAICQKHGAKLFVNERVHLKLYSLDLDSAVIGSANMTVLGLHDGNDANHEVLYEVTELSRNDRIRIHQLIGDSTVVTSSLYSRYADWYEECCRKPTFEEQTPPLPTPEDDLITYKLPHSNDPDRVWELANGQPASEPWEIPAMEHDLGVYPVPPELTRHEFKELLREVFFRQAFVAKLAQQITPEGMQFGRLKQWIRKNCTDVPVPHARDLTFVVQGLMGWFESLAPDMYEVCTPGRYSQVLRRRED